MPRVLLAVLIFLPCCLPAEEPERFGLGRVPPAEEIKQWDIDIMPDGRQLPQGSGTAGQGKVVYQAKCLSCHGVEGKGGFNDQLVSQFDPDINFANDSQAARTIGSYWPYATTLYDYIFRAMPHTTPGTLTPDEIYGLVAYLLYLNGIIDKDREMDAESLPQVQMPARRLFYWSDEVRKQE